MQRHTTKMSEKWLEIPSVLKYRAILKLFQLMLFIGSISNSMKGLKDFLELFIICLFSHLLPSPVRWTMAPQLEMTMNWF
jgi:hypothetical protein